MATIRMLPGRIPEIETRSVVPALKRTDPFYLSPEWRAFIADIVRKRGKRCEDPHCQNPGGHPRRIFGDHIIELRDGGAPFDESNIRLLCGSCHTRKTIEARTQRMRRRP
jgi:5-methylcytosine-specific restriction protein A